MKNLLTPGLLLMLASGSSLAQDSGKPTAKVEHSVDDSPFYPTALRATANGKTYQLIDKSKGMCLAVIDQRDFDGNGLVDALVEDIVACGGNGALDTFFFVSAFPGGRFELSGEFGYSMRSPVIEKWKGRWSLVVSSISQGAGNRKLDETTQRFILESGKAVQVDEWRRKEMESIAEIRSGMFDWHRADETHSLEYDLDGDGRKDRINARFWERWGRMLWTVEFADGKKFSSDISCKRIGVLKTKTNGVSDLVCDQDTVLRWNGREYRATAAESEAAQ